MKNIEQFNLVTAEVLKSAYESFPVPSEMYVGIITNEVAKKFYDDPFADIGSHEPEYKLTQSSIDWLIRVGYIWGEKDENRGIFSNVVLTHLGLKVLNSVPDSLSTDHNSAFGDQLSDYADSGAKTAIQETVKAIISAGLNFAVS